MIQRNLINFFGVILVVLTLMAVTAAIIDRDVAAILFSRGAFYLMFLLVLCWVCTIVQCAREDGRKLGKAIIAHRFGLLLCFALVIIIFLSVKPTFRVLSDETNLLAVSKSMTYEKRVDNVIMGRWYYDNFYPALRVVSRRPLLYPFCTYIVHTLSGYRPENAFVVNFFALLFLLILVYWNIKDPCGPVWASAAVVLIASQPVVVQTATSGGYDLLSVVFLVVGFTALRWFLAGPSALRFQLLWFSLLMLGNVRYEGLIYMMVTIGLLFFWKYIKLSDIWTRSNIFFICTPPILLMTFLQRWVNIRYFQQFENETIWSPMIFLKTNALFLKSLVDFRFFLPYAVIVNIIGVGALIYYIVMVSRKRILQDPTSRRLAIICALCVGFAWIMFSAFFRGGFDHPTHSRFYTGFSVIFSIIALLLLYRSDFLRKQPVYVLILSGVIFMLYHPISVEDRFSRTQTLPRKYRFVLRFLKKQSQWDKNFLIVSTRPGQYTALDYGAVDFRYIRLNPAIKREFRNNLYNEIYVIQDIEYETGLPSKDTRLPRNFALETLEELQTKKSMFVRISRVTAI